MADLNSLKTIVDFLGNAAAVFPKKIGLVFEDKEYTYQDIQRRADSVSSFLVDRLKLKRGDVAAVLLPNIPEMIFGYFGALKAGCAVLLFSANISDESFLFQLKKIKPKIIISQEKYKQKFARTGVVESITYVDIENVPMADGVFRTGDIGPDDISTIIFTSGSTSQPKGVKLRHRNVVGASKNIIEFLKWDFNDIDVHILPLSHSFGLGNLHCVFAVGATTVLFRDAISLKKILQTIIEKKATTFSAVPATLRLILEHYPDDFRACGRCLRFVQTNTSPLEPEFIHKLLAILPATDFTYYYGLSEASRSAFVTLNKHLDKIESVGRASPNVQLKIVDADGDVLSPNQIGEICIKGQHVIEEYWDNPQASKNIENGWLRTGDAGYLDKDGYLYFKGRLDDIINVSGEKVSPEEIEEVAKTILGVIDAAVVGVPDKLLGEVVKLFIATDQENFDIETVKRECQKRLESHKVPKFVEIIKQIPRTENGKLRRHILRS